MKFYGKPNTLVKQRIKNRFSMEVKFKPLFRFDSNGEYETEDSQLIEKLKRKFKYEENVKSEEIKFKCKTCGESFEDKFKLMVHSKTHKKVIK